MLIIACSQAQFTEVYGLFKYEKPFTEEIRIKRLILGIIRTLLLHRAIHAFRMGLASIGHGMTSAGVADKWRTPQ